MNIDEIRNDMAKQGKDLDDYNIKLTNNGYTATPKSHYELKQIAQKEDIKLAAELYYEIMKVGGE